MERGDETSAILGWPFKDPAWASKLLLMGLLWLGLLVVPLVGVVVASINLNGWMLAGLDNLRAGRREIPPPGLQYLRRGLRLFTVELVYFVVLLLVSFGLLGGGIYLSLRAGPHGATSTVLAALFLTVFGQSVLLVFSTAWVAVTPAIVLLTERHGPRAALDLRRLWGMLRGRPRPAVIAGLLALLSLDVIAPFGALACVVGLVLSVPYAYAVLAAVVEWYERSEQDLLRR